MLVFNLHEKLANKEFLESIWKRGIVHAVQITNELVQRNGRYIPIALSQVIYVTNYTAKDAEFVAPYFKPPQHNIHAKWEKEWRIDRQRRNLEHYSEERRTYKLPNRTFRSRLFGSQLYYKHKKLVLEHRTKLLPDGTALPNSFVRKIIKEAYGETREAEKALAEINHKVKAVVKRKREKTLIEIAKHHRDAEREFGIRQNTLHKEYKKRKDEAKEKRDKIALHKHLQSGIKPKKREGADPTLSILCAELYQSEGTLSQKLKRLTEAKLRNPINKRKIQQQQSDYARFKVAETV